MRNCMKMVMIMMATFKNLIVKFIKFLCWDIY
jgi:hypothetical protein